jgi:hypothetical protein
VADDVLAEGDGLDSRRLVRLHRQDVVVGGYSQGLQLRSGPFLKDYLLEVGGNALPQLAVVSGAIDSTALGGSNSLPFCRWSHQRWLL